jgi:hypothetical protein
MEMPLEIKFLIGITVIIGAVLFVLAIFWAHCEKAEEFEMLKRRNQDLNKQVEEQMAARIKAEFTLRKMAHNKADAFMLAKHVLSNAQLGAYGKLLARNSKGQIAKYTVPSVVKNIAKQVVDNDAK